MKQCLHQLLADQAARRPEAPALFFQGASTTYGELEQTSNRIARALQAAGVARGDRVALLLPKSHRAIAAMFGCLKADCVYVPLDVSSPAARIGKILEKCGCSCVVAEHSTTALLSELVANGFVDESVRIAWMDSTPGLSGVAQVQLSWPEIESTSDQPVDSFAAPDAAAHILFTSGSSGTPKGVVITHANVMHFVKWALAYFGMNSEDRNSGHPPLHFDLSTFDIYGTIASGAQLFLLPAEVSLLPHKLADFIRTHQLTQWFSVPWILQQMAKFDVVQPNDFPALKRILWCGETFPTPALAYWMKRLPRVTFDNLYGPTETTIASSHYRVPQCPEDATAEIPIGAPCGGEMLFVLDDNLQPVKSPEVGDLYIGGVGLSPGYWTDPEKTKEAFRPNPYSSNPSDRLYRTGDLAWLGADGMVYLVGRSDTQIKTRGYRVELGEVEAAVHAVPEIQDAAVVAFDDVDGASICCAYVPRSGADLPPIALKKQLSRSLPQYMIPRRWITLSDMPRNANGKIDRPLLREQFRKPDGADWTQSLNPARRGAPLLQ